MIQNELLDWLISPCELILVLLIGNRIILIMGINCVNTCM